MNDSNLKKLEKIKKKLISGMLNYMKPEDEDDDFECSYTEEDVQKCDKILSEYTDELKKLDPPGDEKAIMRVVKRVVLALNKLNEKADFEMIETDQREQLYEYISTAAQASGLKSDDDITEEWRDW